MSIHLDIGPEEIPNNGRLPLPSRYIVNLKTVDASKKKVAHQNVSLDMKEEIKWKKSPKRLCVMSEFKPERKGLGRIPMIAGALLIIFGLNIGQLLFLGKTEGTEALVMAGEAFVTLQSAGEAALTGEQGADLTLFEDALSQFNKAREKGAFLLQSDSPWLTQPKLVKSLDSLLTAAGLMAEVGAHLSQARSSLNTLSEEGSITDYLRAMSESQIEPAAGKLETIRGLLVQVDLSDTGFEDKLMEFQAQLDELSQMLDLWLVVKEPLLTALGDRYPQHYLVLLQNNDEMRLGGGFIGSIAIVEINDGRLTGLDFKDVYDYDGQYFAHQEVPVHELRSLTAEWRLRDSNIFPDFPASAQKAMWFLEEEGGPGVDGVIGVNLSAAQALLEDTGPLTLPSLSKPLSAETFPAVISTLVEAKVYENPKAILGELLTAFTEAVKAPGLKNSVALTLLQESHKKQILFYHKDPHVQELLDSVGMSGSLPKLSTLDHDFLMPLFTNIGGNKTDRYMETDIQHRTRIFDDGSMVSSVTLTRTHTFTDSTMNWLKQTLASYGFSAWNSGLESVLGKSPNRTGIRLYVPKDATILETEGILRDEIQFYYDPFTDLSYYYIDQTVRPGSSETFTVHFALPWTFGGDFKEYTFSLFKQPGLKGAHYEATIIAPDDMMLSAYPLATDFQSGTDYVLSGPFNNDVEFIALYH